MQGGRFQVLQVFTLIGLILCQSVVVSAQNDPLGNPSFVQPLARVHGSGGSANSNILGGNEASAGSGDSEFDAGDVSSRRTEGELDSYAVYTGNPYAIKSAAMAAKLGADVVTATMYNSPLSVLFSSLALTDAGLLAAFQTANQDAHFSSLGLIQVEKSIITQLAAQEGGEQKLKEYWACKKRRSDANVGANSSSTAWEVMMQCIGGAGNVTATPSIPDTITADHTTKRTIKDNAAYEGFSVAEENGTACTGALDTNQDCHRYTAWSLIFSSIQDDDAREALRDEARLLGNHVFAFELDTDTTATEAIALNAQHNYEKRSDWPVAPPVFTANIATGQFTAPVQVQLSGYELMVLNHLQDVYGSIYSLMYKLCEREQEVNDWVGLGGGYQAECPLWTASIVDGWTGDSSGCVVNPGGSESLPGIAVDMWPMAPAAGAWRTRRFYEYPGVPESSITIHDLLANLSSGLNKFSHGDAFIMYEILRRERASSVDNLACDDIFNGAWLGEIMSFIDDPDAPPLSNFMQMATTHWPTRAMVQAPTPGAPEIPLSKRIQMFYNLALNIAKLKVLKRISAYRREVIRSSHLAHKFPKIFKIAEGLMKQGRPADWSFVQELNKLDQANTRIRKEMYEFYSQSQSAVRPSDVAGTAKAGAMKGGI